MLLELVVENYAVVERLRVHFHSGLNLLTGETGSGKSIVVDALGLLLGGRASAEMIRTGEARARVAGIFEVRDQAAVRRIAGTRRAWKWRTGELLIEREILAERKIARLRGQPSGGGGAAEGSGAVAGRHSRPARSATAVLQRSAARHAGRVCAAIASCSIPRRALYQEWRAAARGAGGAGAQRAGEAAAAGSVELPAQGNRKRRTRSRTKTRNWRTSAGCCRTCRSCRRAPAPPTMRVYESPESAVALARIAAKRVDELCRIDATLEGLREHLKVGGIEPAGSGLRAARLSVGAGGQSRAPGRSGDPAGSHRAAEAQVRPHRSRRSWRFWRKCADRSRPWNPPASAWRRCARSASGSRRSSRRRRRELTEARKAAARRLEKRVEAELAQLAMERTVFRVAMAAAAWSAAGADRVEFLVSPNVGEEPRPLEKVASGGEISRIALALKTCLAGPKTSVMRTLVFDEVDTGVGGSAAEGVGRRLKKLAAANQVLCVTHLPQIASFADHHYRVEKQEIARPHGGGDRRIGRRGADARSGAHAERAEAHAGSAQECGAVDQDERWIDADGGVRSNSGESKLPGDGWAGLSVPQRGADCDAGPHGGRRERRMVRHHGDR